MPTISIALTASQAQRFSTALGQELQLGVTPTNPTPRDATMAEAKGWLIDQIKLLTLNRERYNRIKTAEDVADTDFGEPT